MSKLTATLKKFPFVYWLTIFFEFMERGAYYGVMSILSIYMISDGGGLAFDKITAAQIKSLTIPILYALPILSGVLADRYGYKKTLLVSFGLLAAGYTMLSQAKAPGLVTLSLIIFALGSGTFKPVVSGTIAKTTTPETNSLGFGIYYWSINVGAFLFPLILVPYLKGLGWKYIFIASAIATGILLIPGFFLYKEPEREQVEHSENLWQLISKVFVDAIDVLKDLKFIFLILIYSGFWILYFQMFDTVLWYMRDYMNMTPVDNFVHTVCATVGFNINFKFDAEHVTVINAATIICLQLVVSALLKNAKPLPSMISGILMGSLGMAVLAFSTNPWVFIAGLVLFSIGEMTAHPKFLSYVGLIAPKEKVGAYMGYSFLYGVIGTSVGTYLGAKLYVKIVEQMGAPKLLWFIFSMFGILTILGLILYNFIVSRKKMS